MTEVDSREYSNDSANALAKVHGMLASVSPAERKIGEYILANHRKIPHMTLSEVAMESGVSDATAVRFFRSIGYKRWLDLKIALSMVQESSADLIHEKILQDDTAAEITNKVIKGAITALNETAAVMDPMAMEQAVSLIQNAKRIQIIGGGTSGPVAQEMFNRLFRLGLDCRVETDAYLQLMQSALLESEDLLIAISQTGESPYPLKSAIMARKRNCPVICLTGNKLSELAKNSNVIMLSVSHEAMLETMASRIAQYALVHAIYINLAACCIEDALSNERKIWNALMQK